MEKAVDAGKKLFDGIELPGRTAGVIGLGAVGAEVANVALSLGIIRFKISPRLKSTKLYSDISSKS